MELSRALVYRESPDRLLQISDRVYVFDYCFSTDVLDEDAYKEYIGDIVVQLHIYYPDASFMAFNFKEGDMKSKLSNIFSECDMTVIEYPLRYENCPLVPLEIIYHFLLASESWLSVEGQQNVLLMHCERGGWPVLAFMLAGLLLYKKQYTGEQKTLEMMYKQAPKDLYHLLSPLNSQPSQMRYLQYISTRNTEMEWPPSNTPLVLDCLILKSPPRLSATKGGTPVARVYGQDIFKSSTSTKLLFSSEKHMSKYHEMDPVKLNIHCRVQGDVVLECVYLSGTKEEIVFRIMFHTAFVSSNPLSLSRDEVDIMWDAKHLFPIEFKAEVHFLDADGVINSTLSSDVKNEDENDVDAVLNEEFYEVEELFSNADERREGNPVLFHTRSEPPPPPLPPFRQGTSLLWPPAAQPPSSYPLHHMPPPPPPPPPMRSGAYLSASPSLYGVHQQLPLSLASSKAQAQVLPPPPPPPPSRGPVPTIKTTTTWKLSPTQTTSTTTSTRTTVWRLSPTTTRTTTTTTTTTTTWRSRTRPQAPPQTPPPPPPLPPGGKLPSQPRRPTRGAPPPPSFGPKAPPPRLGRTSSSAAP